MLAREPIKLNRECDALEIPSGMPARLPANTSVQLMQFLGSAYTVSCGYGMFRIDVKNADALGLTPPAASEAPAEEFSEELVWKQLKTIFDPEIPVNIADLGLIYSCVVSPAESGGHRIDIKMTMTAPGCGMGNVLKADVESKLSSLPDVKQVNVEIVFEPQWNPSLMSEAARLQLGFDI